MDRLIKKTELTSFLNAGRSTIRRRDDDDVIGFLQRQGYTPEEIKDEIRVLDYTIMELLLRHHLQGHLNLITGKAVIK